MVAQVMKRMSGEELLIMRVFDRKSNSGKIENELNRRAHRGGSMYSKSEDYWAGRNYAHRNFLRKAA
jgi:hypothetical protein